MKLISKKLSFFLTASIILLACQKEYSIETGGFGGQAQGQLVDSLGNCKAVDIKGEYHVDSALISLVNKVIINVNFTQAGKYKIYTDTQNGMHFIDSGITVSAGPSTIALKGYGAPILGKSTSFIIHFNNTICGFTISVDGSGGAGGSNPTGTKGDYFPTTSGSNWEYEYLPNIGQVGKFKVTVAEGLYTLDSLNYAKFGTSLQDTFYFAKDGKGNYYAYSTIDFDYTLLFDSIPNSFITYPFLKESAAVGESWESPLYGPVKLVQDKGMSKALFTIMQKNVSYTIGGKTYTNVIEVQREIMFMKDGGTGFVSFATGSSFYAKDYGLIDQFINLTPKQNISLTNTSPYIR